MFSITVMLPKRRMFWKVRGDAPCGDLVRPEPHQGAGFEEDLPFIRLVDPGDEVEEGCLPGPVGPDDADDAAGLQGEIHPVHGHQTPEALGDFLQFQQVGHPDASRNSRSITVSRSDTALPGPVEPEVNPVRA
jgi:hypothetical protein